MLTMEGRAVQSYLMLKILSWNVQGLRGKVKRSLVEEIITQEIPNLLFSLKLSVICMIVS